MASGSKRTAGGSGGGKKAQDRQMRKAMDANLRELELMHKRVCMIRVVSSGKTIIPDEVVVDSVQNMFSGSILVVEVSGGHLFVVENELQ